MDEYESRGCIREREREDAPIPTGIKLGAIQKRAHVVY